MMADQKPEASETGAGKPWAAGAVGSRPVTSGAAGAA
jgi:hypothetical protein